MNNLASADLLPEERFLLALATLAPDEEDYRTARELCRRDGFSWDAAYVLSMAQRVMPLLALNLEAEAMGEAVPRAVRLRFRRGRIAAKLRNDRFRRLLTGPLTEFEERGVVALLLKGAVLSAGLFPEGTRALGDVDMLVSKSDCAEAARVFEAHGFEKRYAWPGAEDWAVRDYHEVSYVTREAGEPYEVDLHWRVYQENHAYDLEPAGLIGRAVPLSFGSVTVLGTSREDTLVHYATQLGVDELRVDLGRIADIDALVRAGLDWDRVVGVARASGAPGVLHLALSLSSMVGSPVPTEVMRRLIRQAPGCATASDVLADPRLPFGRRVPRFSVVVALLPFLYGRWRNRLAYWLRLPFPPSPESPPSLHVQYEMAPGQGPLGRTFRRVRRIALVAFSVLAACAARAARRMGLMGIDARLRRLFWHEGTGGTS